MATITKSAKVTGELCAMHVVKALTQMTHKQMRGLFDHGCVSVNRQRCDRPTMRVQTGDEIEVCYDPTSGYRDKKRKWIDRSFSIVYEDQEIIVVDKAAQVLTVATNDGKRNSLVDRISKYLQHTSRRREAFAAHRLDRGVSGLLVFGQSREVLRRLQDQFRQRKPDRRYVAIVAGSVTPKRGTLRSRLETGDNLDQFSTRDESKGQLAITHYAVLKELRDLTVVEVRLETGRRNQIRVHFAERGHPVLGDPRYRPGDARHERWREKRLALHAASLGFEHPITRKWMQFESGLPACMRSIIES